MTPKTKEPKEYGSEYCDHCYKTGRQDAFNEMTDLSLYKRGKSEAQIQCWISELEFLEKLREEDVGDCSELVNERIAFLKEQIK